MNKKKGNHMSENYRVMSCFLYGVSARKDSCYSKLDSVNVHSTDQMNYEDERTKDIF